MNEGTLIAVYPNTTGFGFVILNEKGEILDYGITAIRPAKNEKCIKKIKEVVEYYQPSILILEDYENSVKSARVKELIKQIYNCVNEGVKIFEYTRDQVKDTFELFGARNKYEISQKISEIYPELKTKLPNKRKSWEPENYYQGVFDALALFFTHQYLND
jgi:Holliday junction resolvasome RuvABC endonuclease subunit